MTVEMFVVALLAGLAGGAVAAVGIGSVQAWMARPKGMGRIESMMHRPGPPQMVAPVSPPSAAAGGGPSDRFNESGKRVLSLAQDEAIRHNHNYIGTEHLLAALLRDEGTFASRALTSLGIELTKVRTATDFIIGRGDQPTSPSDITLSPRTKKVIELAIDESRRMGQSHVGAEHILLGVIREGEGIASGVIESLGVSLPTLRMKVLELLAQSGTPPPASYAAPPPPPRAHGWGPSNRFTDRAKRVLALAQDEATRMGHTYIGPEHVLLGLARLADLRQADPSMKRIFDTLGVTLEQIRTELGTVIPASGQPTLPSEITLSPETRELLQFAHESAPDRPVVPEDLLLAAVRDEQSFGAQLLARLGVTPERVRAAVGH
ncbi:MAG TPA: Clp protease N-terminal domain-containing protein [Candidatus Limnocylindria bacterium]